MDDGEISRINVIDAHKDEHAGNKTLDIDAESRDTEGGFLESSASVEVRDNVVANRSNSSVDGGLCEHEKREGMQGYVEGSLNSESPSANEPGSDCSGYASTLKNDSNVRNSESPEYSQGRASNEELDEVKAHASIRGEVDEKAEPMNDECCGSEVSDDRSEREGPETPELRFNESQEKTSATTMQGLPGLFHRTSREMIQGSNAVTQNAAKDNNGTNVKGAGAQMCNQSPLISSPKMSTSEGNTCCTEESAEEPRGPSPVALDDLPLGASISDLQSYTAALIATNEHIRAMEFLLRNVEYWKDKMAQLKEFAMSRMKIGEETNTELRISLKTSADTLRRTEEELNATRDEIKFLKSEYQKVHEEKQHFNDLLLQLQDEAESLRAKTKDLEADIEKNLRDRDKIELLNKQQVVNEEIIDSLRKTLKFLETEHADRLESLRSDKERVLKILNEEKDCDKKSGIGYKMSQNDNNALSPGAPSPPGNDGTETCDPRLGLKEIVKETKQECAEKIRSVIQSTHEDLQQRYEEIEKLKEELKAVEQKKFKEFTTQIEDLSNELKEKNKQVGCLKSEVINLKSQLGQFANDQGVESRREDSFFEKKLVKRLLIGLLTGLSISDSKLDVAKRLVNVLEFDEDEAAAVGLAPKQSGQLIGSKDTGVISSVDGMNQNDRSFLDLWVKFLLKDIEKN